MDIYSVWVLACIQQDGNPGEFAASVLLEPSLRLGPVFNKKKPEKSDRRHFVQRRILCLQFAVPLHSWYIVCSVSRIPFGNESLSCFMYQRRSPFTSSYGTCNPIIQSGLQNRLHYSSTINEQLSFRMRTATSKFVTCLDVFVVVGACTCGVISGLFGTKKLREINRKLRDADKELSLLNDEARDKKKGIILLLIVFSWMTVMIILDIVSRTRSITKMKVQNNKSKIGRRGLRRLQRLNFLECCSGPEKIYIIPYLPFYVLYYILIGLQTQFAQTALGVARRYRRLNMAVQSIFSMSKSRQCPMITQTIEVQSVIPCRKSCKLCGQ